MNSLARQKCQYRGVQENLQNCVAQRHTPRSKACGNLICPSFEQGARSLGQCSGLSLYDLGSILALVRLTDIFVALSLSFPTCGMEAWKSP